MKLSNLANSNSNKEFYKDIYQIRRNNLILLAERYTNYTELKSILGISASYLSELVSKDLKKKISDSTARNIEVSTELPHGWMDNEHSPIKAEDKNIPVYTIDQIGKKEPIPFKYHTISISGEFICDFCLEIGSQLENPLLPNGTIALFKNINDVRFLRTGDVVIVRKNNKTYLSYYKIIANKKYLVSLFTLEKEDLYDEKITLFSKMVYAIMKHVPEPYSDFFSE